jgi:hypothetical protein
MKILVFLWAAFFALAAAAAELEPRTSITEGVTLK